MSKILLIETATEVCSVAIGLNGEVAAIEEAPEPLNHAASLTIQIGRCAAKAGIAMAELDAVAVSKGPGSYTSLRVGVSAAKGICYALNKPLIAVDTLQALAIASRAFPDKRLLAGPVFFVPMIDARRNEVWTNIYNAAFEPLAQPQPLILENNSFVDFVSSLAPQEAEVVFVLSGNGMDKVLKAAFGENTVWSDIKKCSAEYLFLQAEIHLQNAEFQDIAYFEPLYLKPPNITVSTKSAWHEK